mmetsp:Transcript_251/g.692  ORF Transcript_251/g.692 Transcript_251/m.692 type:complete len:297 (-) Transcript_251:294-1184(-)
MSILHDLFGMRSGGESRVGRLQGADLPEQNPEGVGIDALVVGLSARHLGRHVPQGTGVGRHEVEAVVALVGRIQPFGQSKIEDLEVAAGIESHVVWFQITIHDGVGMQIVHGVGDITRRGNALHPRLMQGRFLGTAVSEGTEPKANVLSHDLAPMIELAIQRDDQPIQDDEEFGFVRIGIGQCSHGDDVLVRQDGKEVGLDGEIDDALRVLLLREVRPQRLHDVLRVAHGGREASAQLGVFIGCVINLLQIDGLHFADDRESALSQHASQGYFGKRQLGQSLVPRCISCHHHLALP